MTNPVTVNSRLVKPAPEQDEVHHGGAPCDYVVDCIKELNLLKPPSAPRPEEARIARSPYQLFDPSTSEQ